MNGRQLIDAPLTEISEESLGIRMYADILATFIRSCETPITIGIQGDWGIGKTSLLNMVRKLINPQGRKFTCHSIYFNTWQYSQFKQEELLGISVLKGIMHEIELLGLDASKKDERAKNAVLKFSKLLLALGNQVLKEKTGINVKEAQAEVSAGHESVLAHDDIISLMRQLKEEFRNVVATTLGEVDRLVILIDDLDRIKPIRALELLDAIKNFLDVEKCVFVIAVDYSVVQAGMEEKLGRSARELQGKSYFDKIIQVPFNMPVSSYQIDRYLMSLLGWDYDDKLGKYVIQRKEGEYPFLRVRSGELDNEKADFFTNITSLTVGNNPRSIKRAVNYSNLLKMIVQRRRAGKREEWSIEDGMHLYPLACLQLEWPEVFNHFMENPSPETIAMYQNFDYLDRIPGVDALWARSADQRHVKSRITGFFDEYIALIDKDENENIEASEFQPIWKMMSDANLTSVELKDSTEDWKRLLDRIRLNMGTQGADENGLAVLTALFRGGRSKWHNNLKFKLYEAGKKFFNVLWDGRQVGTISTMKCEPIQIYFKVSPDTVHTGLSEELRKYVQDYRGKGHRGVGDTKIEFALLAQTGREGDRAALMNRMHEIVTGGAA